MDEAVREFLKKHRTAARWLDDIIDVIIGRGGKAHVNAIAHELAKTDLRDIDTIEQTVTRRVNDYCSDARDFKKSKEHDLFERIEPGTYRLRTYPDRPDIIELVRIEFDDVTMQSMWQSFKEAAHKQQRAKWSDASNERKIAAFAKWILKEAPRAEYERRKAAEPRVSKW